MWRKSPEAKPSSSPRPVTSGEPTSGATPSRPSAALNAENHVPVGISISTPKSASYLSSGLKLKGAFSGTSDLTIDTSFEGNIELNGSLVKVGADGHVASNIVAGAIEVRGTVLGNLSATERIHLESGSSVRGNLCCRRIQIDDGASFRGSIDMDDAKASSSTATGREAQRARMFAHAAGSGKAAE